ncbi:MAG: LysM peptidoglycan-binding domain-containing protein [Leptothrix ochracea]|uniref:LysM peptidoglycan-binding domain-containing protein n=1 Tax=Leptothrix ochracea TaxID=735331 RepID=UPI0034E19C73
MKIVAHSRPILFKQPASPDPAPYSPNPSEKIPMTVRCRLSLSAPHRLLGLAGLAGALFLTSTPGLAEPAFPISGKQRETAQQVSKAGVPLSELAQDAPDTYTVKAGDTLWGISTLFLKGPWRWPELWGMNMDQVRNPHLIYPGQMLVLLKAGGRAQLKMGRSVDGAASAEDPTLKYGPRARPGVLGISPIATIPMHLIRPFLNEAVVLESNELEAAPRIVAGRDARSFFGRGDTVYVRGNIPDIRDWRLFRMPKPLYDPDSKEILGFEAAYVGAAEYTRRGEVTPLDDEHEEIVPATFALTSLRQEAGIGDRLVPAPKADDGNFMPHAPTEPMTGRVISLYGEAMAGGQFHIVAINRGQKDAVERGHVLALWRAGAKVTDKTDPAHAELRLPDESHGHVLIFRVFDRVSYGLILSAQTPVRAGDLVTQP